MNLNTLIAICDKYSDLGGAITNQITDVLNDNIEETNLNALKRIRGFLGHLINMRIDDEELTNDLVDTDEEISKYLANPNNNEEIDVEDDFQEILTEVKKQVETMKNQGKSVEDIVEALNNQYDFTKEEMVTLRDQLGV